MMEHCSSSKLYNRRTRRTLGLTKRAASFKPPADARDNPTEAMKRIVRSLICRCDDDDTRRNFVPDELNRRSCCKRSRSSPSWSGGCASRTDKSRQPRGSALVPNRSSSSSTVLKVKTGGFRLPGLTLETTATIGANLIATTDESALRYEFVLIADERSVSGATPIVWIYDRLTGGSRCSDSDGDTTTTCSLESTATTVSANAQAGSDFYSRSTAR